MAIVVTIATGAGVAIACQPACAGTSRQLLAVGAPHALFAALTCYWLHRRGELKERLAPHRGDVAIGTLVAGMLYLLGMLANHLFTGRGSFGEPWIARIYLHVGDPPVTTTFAVGIALLGIGALEEIVWRGGVMACLTDAHGARRAWWMAAVLSALAYAPTVLLLADTLGRPNPLVVVGVLVASLVWALMAAGIGRVMPSAFSHAVLLWAVVEFPLWRP